MIQHACFETSRNLIKTAAAAFCMAFACCNFAFAEAVTENEASEAVIGWASLKDALGQDFSGAEADGVLTYTGIGGTGTYHVVSLKSGGFVVTSGDTAMEPILAYSKEGVWNTNAAKWSRLRAAASAKGGARLQAAKPTADLRCDKLVQDGTNTFFKAVIE